MNQHKMLNKKFVNRLIFPVIVIIAFMAGYFLAPSGNEDKIDGIKLLRPGHSDYDFINPLVGVDLSPNQEFSDLKSLEKIITDYVKDKKLVGDVDKISIYFRNLNNAHWFVINGEEKFDPGSLLKVPLMMAYFKVAEVNPSILDKKILYVSSSRKPLLSNELKSKLVTDTHYIIADLIKFMIIDSDNVAKDLLLDNLDFKYIVEVYGDLGIPLVGSNSDLISAGIYTSFFRRLYNATFLNREYSEKALELLSQTTFNDGIVKGLPSGIVVAHKYGERGVYTSSGALVGFELHDCGIIYLSDQPKALCIMTQGRDLDKIEKVMQKITSIINLYYSS